MQHTEQQFVLFSAILADVGTFGASIPYAGTVVALALVAGGFVGAVSLGVVARALSSLDTCLRAHLGSTRPRLAPRLRLHRC
jgi:hypothetical protein